MMIMIITMIMMILIIMIMMIIMITMIMMTIILIIVMRRHPGYGPARRAGGDRRRRHQRPRWRRAVF